MVGKLSSEEALALTHQNRQLGLAIFDWDTLLPSYENALFLEWLPAVEGKVMLSERLPALKIDRLRKRLLKGSAFSSEHEIKVENRSKILKLHFSRTDSGQIFVNTTDYTKEKEVEYLLDSYVKMAESNKRKLEQSLEKIKAQKEELIVMNSALERERNMIELSALQAVINPHFVSNCLASIQRFIVDHDTEMSVNYLSHFGKLMRLSFEQSYLDYVAISDILQLLATYASIEKIRIDHKWELIFDIDEKLDIQNLKIPPLLIQPFLENAIWHGINNKKEGGLVKLTLILIDEHTLKCVVEDNGLGRKASDEDQVPKVKSRLHSLNVTSKRLDIMWQEHERSHQIRYEDPVDEDGNPCGTKVELLIPISF